jgi:hypothetical protein
MGQALSQLSDSWESQIQEDVIAEQAPADDSATDKWVWEAEGLWTY